MLALPARAIIRAAAHLAWTWRALERVAVQPDLASPRVVFGAALLPPVLAGALYFRLIALEMLGVALAAGILVALIGRLLARVAGEPEGEASPVLAAVVGVALIGARAGVPWAAVVAVAAPALELARARFAPSARIQAGLLAYSLILLVSMGGPAAYAAPGSAVPSPEPIRLWLDPALGGQAPDWVRLYAGDVAGPVFATSLLAVAVGAAWMWYARRLSLLVLLLFLVGAGGAIAMEDWPAAPQLVSGPLWFVAALLLADRRTLPTSAIGRPLIGVAAGFVTIVSRTRGLAIESAPLTVAATQTLVAVLDAARWMVRHPDDVRARLRDLRALAVLRPRLGASR